MTLQITDANGNAVNRITGICARCGAHIKHIFTFGGQTYGSECIEVVTGIGRDYQVFRGNDLDLKASKTRKAQAEANQAARLADYEARQQAIREVQQANRTRFEEVIYLLENTPGDFCASVASQIKFAVQSTELYDILSHRQFEIVSEIWGKAHGRRGSAACENAIFEFYEKFGEKDNA